MASTFDKGTAGTMAATTLPAALAEIAARVEAAEAAITTNTPNNVQLIADLDNQLLSITASLPITSTLSSGSIQISATDYINTAGGTSTFAGGGGDAAATHLAAAFLEIAQLVQEAEAASSAIPQPNNVQVSIDLDNNLASINAALPSSLAVNSSNGKLEVTATDYL